MISTWFVPLVSGSRESELKIFDLLNPEELARAAEIWFAFGGNESGTETNLPEKLPPRVVHVDLALDSELICESCLVRGRPGVKADRWIAGTTMCKACWAPDHEQSLASPPEIRRPHRCVRGLDPACARVLRNVRSAGYYHPDSHSPVHA